MSRKAFFIVSLAATLISVGSFNAFSQQQDAKAAAQPTCEEFLAKKLTAEQYKTLPDEAKKTYDAEVKRCEEGVARNAKIKNSVEIINRVLKEGNDAYASKNFDVAIAKYDEGYNADTEYWGSAPIMLNNKAAALRARGVIRFNEAAKNKDAAGKAAAKQDFQDAVDANAKAVEILSKATAPTDAAQAKNFQTYKASSIADRAESYRLLVKADNGKAADAVKAYQEYVAIETDPAKKSKAEFNGADMALEAGSTELAVAEFQKIVAQDPSNAKAMYKLGIALIAQGSADPADKVKVQDGVNYLQKFVDTAPDTDADKTYAKETIEAMKASQNVTPQKGAARSAGKRKS
jgi:hypothetical protein